MLSSAAIQNSHELAVIHDESKLHNLRFGLTLKAISEPDPPDAVFPDGSSTTWMEVTDAICSKEYARHLSTHNSIKGHQPMARGLRSDMDDDFAITFAMRLLRRLEKLRIYLLYSSTPWHFGHWSRVALI